MLCKGTRLLEHFTEGGPAPVVDDGIWYIVELGSCKLDPEAVLFVLENPPRFIKPANRLVNRPPESKSATACEGQVRWIACPLETPLLRMISEDSLRPRWVQLSEVLSASDEVMTVKCGAHRRQPPCAYLVVRVTVCDYTAFRSLHADIPGVRWSTPVGCVDYAEVLEAFGICAGKPFQSIGGFIVGNNDLPRAGWGPLAGQGVQLRPDGSLRIIVGNHYTEHHACSASNGNRPVSVRNVVPICFHSSPSRRFSWSRIACVAWMSGPPYAPAVERSVSHRLVGIPSTKLAHLAHCLVRWIPTSNVKAGL